MTVPMNLDLLTADQAVLYDRDVAERLDEFLAIWPPGLNPDTGRRIGTEIHFDGDPPSLYLANGRNRLRIAQFVSPSLGWETRRYSLLRPRSVTNDEIVWELPSEDLKRYEHTYMQMGILVERQYLFESRVAERRATAAAAVPPQRQPPESAPRAPEGSSEGKR